MREACTARDDFESYEHEPRTSTPKPEAAPPTAPPAQPAPAQPSAPPPAKPARGYDVCGPRNLPYDETDRACVAPTDKAAPIKTSARGAKITSDYADGDSDDDDFAEFFDANDSNDDKNKKNGHQTIANVSRTCIG